MTSIFLKTGSMTKNFYFIGSPEACVSFWCAYQKEICYIVKENPLFALIPKNLEPSFINLSVSRQIEILSYRNRTLKKNFYKNKLENKIGLIFIEDKDLPSTIKEFNTHTSIIVDIESINKVNPLIPITPHDMGISCCLETPSKDILKVLNYTLTHKTPIAFLWDSPALGSILNPEIHVLRFLENQFGVS